MARDTCADCKGPREPEATSYSYCVECGRKRQRDKYRAARLAAGHPVKARVADADERRTFLRNGDGKPGMCESCSQHEPIALVLEHYSTSLPPDPNDFAGKPFALWCSECHKTAQSLTSDELRRATQILQSLERHKVDHGAVLKDLDPTMFEPPPLPNKNAQKSTP